tara:strand:- start:72 stop:491 length:420 start_codon:yes stop_codon:yes gene_type:complete
MGVLKKGAELTLKQLQKLKKQAEKEVAKEEKLARKKFHPDESAEMNDLAESKMKLQGIQNEIDKIEKLDKPFKSGRRIGSIKKPIKTKKLKVDQKNIIKKEPKDKLGNVIESLPTPRRGNGKLRGVGKALRGGGKVMRG